MEQEIRDRLQQFAHQKLAQSELLNRSVLDGTRIGTWQWNVQTGETLFNERWAEIIGYRLDELQPISIDTWLGLVHPDDGERSNALLQQHFSGEAEFYDCQCRMQHKDGHWVWVHDRGRLVSRTADGQPLMMYGTHADISEQKEAEQALLASRDKLEKMTQQLPGVVYQFQQWPDGHFAFPYASESIYQIYGVTPEQVRHDASAVFSVIVPDDIPAVTESILRSKTELSLWQHEYRVKRQNGDVAWMAGRAMPEAMPDGSVLWHGYIYEITERKQQYLALEQAYSELNLAQQRLEQASRQARIGYWRATLRTGELWWSPMIYDIFGFDPEFTQPNIALFNSMVHPDDLDKLAESEARAFQSGEHNVIHRIVRPDGEIRWVHELAQLLPVQDFPEQVMVGSVQDVTEFMRLQRLKDEFISTVSHELRTPLTSIGGAIKLLVGTQQLQLNDTAQMLLDVAQSNISRLQHLINDLLDIEKLSAGKMKLELKTLKVLPLLQHARRDHATFAEKSRVKLELQVTEDLADAELKVDEHRLQQILANLLSNALKFSPDGGLVVLEAHRQGSQLEISVTDQGPGIPTEFHSKIFQRFSQADASSSKSKGGTGLGLALCKELADVMGGTIGFISTPGQGSRFFVRFPLLF
ncbi:PAS domain-containing protein [Rheinheimera marina]|uniref:PAS domain-containing sensor histidine kinase n=1 Tax=Rheinheimera marina TaxID=1774958 RepID=UPI003A97DA9A